MSAGPEIVPEFWVNPLISERSDWWPMKDRRSWTSGADEVTRRCRCGRADIGNWKASRSAIGKLQSVSLKFVLIPRMGVAGAVWATIIAFSLLHTGPAARLALRSFR